jgi:hypothetical protein
MEELLNLTQCLKLTENNRLSLVILCQLCSIPLPKVSPESPESKIFFKVSQLQELIQPQVILKISLDNYLNDYLNKIIGIITGFLRSGRVEVLGGGNIFLNSIKPLICVIMVVSGMAFQIAKNDLVLQENLTQNNTVTTFNVTKMTENTKVPATIFNWITTVSDENMLKNIVDELNEKYSKYHTLLQNECENMFEAWPVGQPYKFSVEELKKTLIKQKPELIKQNIMSQLDNEYENTIGKDNSDTKLPSAKETGVLVGETINNAVYIGTTSAFGFLQGMAQVVASPLLKKNIKKMINDDDNDDNDNNDDNDDNEIMDNTANDNTAIVDANKSIIMSDDAPTDKNLQILKDAVKQYKTNIELENLLQVIPEEKQHQIVVNAQELATVDVTTQEILFEQTVNLQLLSQNTCSLIPKPEIVLGNEGELSFINHSNSDVFFLEKLNLLELNIMQLVDNNNNNELELEKNQHLKSVIEKIKLMRKLIVEAYRFRNTNVFKENESIESMIQKMREVEAIYGEKTFDLVSYFLPITKQATDFMNNMNLEKIETDKAIHNVTLQQQEQTLIEAKTTTNYFTGLIGNTVGEVGSWFGEGATGVVGWANGLVASGIYGLVGPFAVLFSMAVLSLIVIYRPTLLIGKEQPTASTGTNRQPEQPVATTETNIQSIRQRRKPGWGPAKNNTEEIIVQIANEVAGLHEGQRLDRATDEWRLAMAEQEWRNHQQNNSNGGGTRKAYRKKKALRKSAKRNGKKTIKKNHKRNNKKNTKRLRKKQ